MHTHGKERNRHLHRELSIQQFKTAEGNVVVSYSEELTVAERYCNPCGEWVSTKALGLMGHVMCPQCHSLWRKS
jgi:hypothetical protein